MAAPATPTNSSAPPQTHQVCGRSRNVLGEGVKWAVSQRVLPPRRRGNSGTANFAAPKDSTACAAKDGPVWFHCSAPAVRYEGKCGADLAHASHSEHEPSMKGLNRNAPALYLCSAAGKLVSTGYIPLQGAIGGEREGFRQNQANFNFCTSSA